MEPILKITFLKWWKRVKLILPFWNFKGVGGLTLSKSSRKILLARQLWSHTAQRGDLPARRSMVFMMSYMMIVCVISGMDMVGARMLLLVMSFGFFGAISLIIVIGP